MSSSGSSGSHLHDPFSDSTPAILASAHPDAVTDFLQLVDDREAAFFHARRKGVEALAAMAADPVQAVRDAKDGDGGDASCCAGKIYLP
jgi:hypothetical protein